MKSRLYRRRSASAEDEIPLLPISRKSSSMSLSTSSASPPPPPPPPPSTWATICPSASASASAKKPRLTLTRAINHLRRNAHEAFVAAAVLPCCPVYVAVQLATFGL
ncbi:hypothetical protein E4U21_007683 [Claviceps maximensis]|nr:hypothetical protein E4U21_007683 [Claviceps maximensis]